MKKILILIGLCLTLSLSGQIYPGVIAASGGGAAGAPACLSTNTFAWYSAEVGNVTKDGSDLVSNWDDLSTNDYDLVQATGTNQPVWSATGITFDGVDNYLATGAKTLNQPEHIYIVVKNLVWGDGDRFFDGETSYHYGALYMQGTTPNIRARANTESAQNGNLTVNTFSIIRVLFNGASSKLTVNATAATEWNCGAQNMGGFVLGTMGDYDTGYCGNITVKEIIIRSVADSAGDEAAIYAYLKAKYGLNMWLMIFLLPMLLRRNKLRIAA